MTNLPKSAPAGTRIVLHHAKRVGSYVRCDIETDHGWIDDVLLTDFGEGMHVHQLPVGFDYATTFVVELLIDWHLAKLRELELAIARRHQ